MSNKPVNHLPAVTLEYVSKAYGDDYLNYDQLVLKNVSLTIRQGEFVIIFGPSGSGKSTLLNVMAGLERPSAGRVKVKSHDLGKYDEEQLAKYHRRKMGMVFQSFNLIKSLSVWENVALPQTAEGIPIRRRRRRAHHLLKMLGVEEYMDRHPNELSGGEQQRVAIARALVNNPLLLLVDEPTGNLDSKMADEVMRIFYDLHYHSKHTIVLVTHNPEYLQYASRIIHIQDGEVKRQEWRPQESSFQPQHLKVEQALALQEYRDEELVASEASHQHPTGPALTPGASLIESGAHVDQQPYKELHRKEKDEIEERAKSSFVKKLEKVIGDGPAESSSDKNQADKQEEQPAVLFHGK